ncbi:uncharacterized protein RCC_02690 [Ramularia collo-cygni]|uniref:Sulfatase N-terminal domain-containing protein n=1 Tax=Ramularia collo-cygni TaxID=112498 RepID=A0A2D3USR4_9PEZI|nr:uncharacterized protein RCC_02690 [Ramularia collo-cygni]CZT16855.1 uncharacterized protein RCC_02690 [Ramularia collo-cygni]
MLVTSAVALLALAFILQSACHAYAEVSYGVFGKLISLIRPQAEDLEEKNEAYDFSAGQGRLTRLLHRLACIILVWQLVCTVLHSCTQLSSSLSWSLPVLALAHLFVPQATHHAHPIYKTALARPVPFTWLPEHPQAGFSDWYNTDMEHYTAEKDVLRVPSLDLKLLPALQEANLKRLSIRNVLLLTLESTRKDAFPFNSSGSIANSLAGTFEGKVIPLHVSEGLASLDPFAKYFVGQSEDTRWPARGRINAEQAFTTSTYTLKSLTGTVCGITPLAADFNEEYSHNIYQPCLPHIMSTLNNLNASRRWESKYMQSTTLSYDKQDRLLPKMGFDDIIGGEYLKEKHKFGPAHNEDVNYFGMPEEVLEDYIRDAFITAREKGENLFLSHLTSTTHHGFGIPEVTKFAPQPGLPRSSELSNYLNAIGYVDGWLGRIMTILQEEGVFNETLVIAVGDHGLALAEHGHHTAFEDPHIATLHVPLVISLPGLPNIDITETVTSLQILPTILDLLIETDSLSDEQSKAAHDLLHNSEGQSLLRVHPGNETGYWHFHITNPGGTTVSVHDARRPSWRLAVPLIPEEPWRFVDLAHDPWELKPLRAMNPETLTSRAALYNTTLPAEWLAEAADIAEWWLQENHRRWRYESYDM